MNIAQRIEHTCLKPTTDKKDIDKLLQEAQEHEFRAVCIPTSWVKYARTKLGKSPVKIVTVTGFPLGTSLTQVKVFEAQLAIKNGADEVDMVINVGRLKDHQDAFVLEEINKVKSAIGQHPLKVIVESSLLNANEKRQITKLVSQSNADYIKTSTGFSYGGATVEDIQLFKEILQGKIKIKASAGIKTFAQAQALIDAGADVIGTSSGVEIVKGQTHG